MLQKIDMFDLELVNSSYQDLLDCIFEGLDSESKDVKYVFTPNNEMIVEANKNNDFKEVLKSAWLNLPDSTGLYFASKLLSDISLKSRLTGVDTTQKFLEINRKYKVFLLGGAKGAAAKVAEMYPESMVVGTSEVFAREENDEKIVKSINKSGAEVLFVAFGAPKQEMWIARNTSKLENLKLAMGVGGTFDFIAGIQRRAPSFMRKLGLEWLWRLCKEPKRFMRIFRALVVFPLLVLKEKLF